MYIIDIWGGKNSQEHLARFISPLKDSIKIVELEIQKGFLVNIVEKDESISDNDLFDNRCFVN